MVGGRATSVVETEEEGEVGVFIIEYLWRASLSSLWLRHWFFLQLGFATPLLHLPLQGTTSQEMDLLEWNRQTTGESRVQ